MELYREELANKIDDAIELAEEQNEHLDKIFLLGVKTFLMNPTADRMSACTWLMKQLQTHYHKNHAVYGMIDDLLIVLESANELIPQGGTQNG